MMCTKLIVLFSVARPFRRKADASPPVSAPPDPKRRKTEADLPGLDSVTSKAAKKKEQSNADPGGDELERRLADLGLWIHPIQPDGNCAFEAFRHQLISSSPGNSIMATLL